MGRFRRPRRRENSVRVEILDVLEGRPIYTLKGHHVGVTSITFSKDGKLFASGGVDRRILIWKTNLCMDGQIGKIPTQLMPSITKQDNMDEKSSSDECEEIVHKKQTQEKYLSDTFKKLHLKSDKSHRKRPSSRKTKSEMVTMKNIKSSERNYELIQDQTSPDAPLSNQSIKTVEAFCDKVQSLYDTVNVLERRMTILEETLNNKPLQLLA